MCRREKEIEMRKPSHQHYQLLFPINPLQSPLVHPSVIISSKVVDITIIRGGLDISQKVDGRTVQGQKQESTKGRIGCNKYGNGQK